MKNLFRCLCTAVLAVVFSLSAFADDAATLSKIEKANASVKSVEAHFAQKKLLRASGKITNTEGTFYYMASDKLAMVYDAPSTDKLIINGSKCYVNRGGKGTTLDAAKNATAASLSNTLLFCIQGKVQKAADDNNATIKIVESGSDYVITLTAKSQATRGYSKIVLHYRKSDSLLVLMETEEVGGINTTYTISGIKTGATVAATVFDLPKK